MENGICDGSSSADKTDFSHALGAWRVHAPIVFLKQISSRYRQRLLGRCGVLGQIMIHESPCVMSQHAVSVQCLAYTPDDAARDLIRCGLRVERLLRKPRKL